MINNWTLACFYSKGTPYEKVAYEYLIPSAAKFGLSVKAIEAPNYKNWNRNVAEKPRIILELLEGLSPNDALVFLDADATIEKFPDLFNTLKPEVDLAFHRLSWNLWYGYSCGTQELLTGTMFLRSNDRVKDLCKEWYIQALESDDWEQKVLQNIISKYKNLGTEQLPLEYCFMKTRPGGKPPLITVEPVILHHQLSRTLKNEIRST